MGDGARARLGLLVGSSRALRMVCAWANVSHETQDGRLVGCAVVEPQHSHG